MTAGSPFKRPVRPADAAGLVLLRGTGRESEVLLGRRHPDMRFMPNVYVFPGGRVEALDRASSGFAEAMAPPEAKLDRFTRLNLPVLARTALRETFEETGLLVGTAAPSAEDTPSSQTVEPWRSYRQNGLKPAFAALHLVARAITPAASRIRFHSRFFRAEGDAVHGQLGGSGELVDIGWIPVGQVQELPMSSVTALILRQALAHRAASLQGRMPAPALFRWIGSRSHAAHSHAAWDPLEAAEQTRNSGGLRA